MMQTDVKSVVIDDPGLFYNGPTRIKGFVIAPSTSGCTVAFTDGNGGPTVFIYSTASGVPISINVPGEGIKVNNGIYCSQLDTVGNMSVFYG